MKRREDRLRRILEAIEARPEGLDSRILIGRICRDFNVAPQTVRDDLEDLELRRWISRRFGVLRILEAGHKASLLREIPAGQGQSTLEGAKP